MRKFLIAAALLGATAAFASDETVAGAGDLTPETYLGKTVEEASASLTGLGYDVRKSDREDGAFEFYVVKDRRKYEVYVSPETGRFLRMERD